MRFQVTLKRWQRLILAGLLLGFVAVNALAAWQAWALTHPAMWSLQRVNEHRSRWLDSLAGTVDNSAMATALPVPEYQDIRFQTDDGISIAAWLSDDDQATSSMVICHGHGSSRFSMKPEADYFRGLGYRVLLFDFRAHGESSGTVCSVGYKEASGIKAAWDLLRQKYPDQSISIYGISMGAVAAARAVAVNDLKPDRLILDMPFDNLLDAVQSRIRMAGLPAEPLATMITFWGGVEQGFWPFSFCTSNYMRQIDCPVLVQRGESDNRVSAEEIQRIAQASHGEAVLHSYPDVGHVSLCKFAHDAWAKNVGDFLR